MKKALIVANLGGFATFLISDMQILQNMGYKIYYAANVNTLPWESTRKKLEDLGINIINIDIDSKNPISKKNIKAYRQIKDILKKENFDLIHCHTPIPGLLLRLAARKQRKKGTKIIYTTHGLSYTKYSSKKNKLLYYNIENFASKYSDAIITINKEDYEEVKKMKCKKVYYINGVGVDIDKYSNVSIDRKKYRKSLDVDENKLLILSVGELSNRKNHRIIIQAIGNMEEKQKYVYVICGNGIDGGTGKELRELAIEHNVDLKLLGFRRDIPEIIQCSDIGAIPSKREGLGLAGIQSLAGGVPLVASDVQGIKDYVIDGKTGFLCNANDLREFQSAIKKLSDRKIREDMKEECKMISRQFDITISKEQRKEIYKQVMEEEYN